MSDRLIVIAAIVAAVAAGVVAADETGVPTQTGDAARSLLREALSAREQVRSGHVRIKGYYRYEVAEGEAGYEGPVSGLYLFDREANVYRYDGEWPCRTRINRPGDFTIRPADATTPIYTAKYGFCRGREYFAEWGVVGPAISDVLLHRLSEEKANRSWGCGRWPLDVMALGMFEQSHRSKGTAATEMYALILAMPEMAIVSEDERTARIRVGSRGWTFTIDLDRELAAPVVSKEVAPTTIGVPARFETEVKWQAMQGVAVPVKYVARYFHPEGAEETLMLLHEWVSINAAIPESEFEYSAFQGIPPRKLDVVDRRGERPVRLGRWIGDGGQLEP